MATKKKRTQCEIFLDKLKKMSKGEQRFISNIKLRESLGWGEERYNRVKSQLLEENAVIVGRGFGGSVGIADAPGSKALILFIAYSHADEKLKDDLLKHLEPLKRLNLIDIWHDRKLRAGEEWGKNISDNLEKADIILLLISIDFINSKYCYDIELERALELHAEEQAVVIPIILRNCLWQHTPFVKLQALPKDAKAVSTWSNLDEALTIVADGIRQVAEKIRERPRLDHHI